MAKSNKEFLDEPPEIEIRITGNAAVGKTTVALVILDALEAKGFTRINFTNPDGDAGNCRNTLHKRLFHVRGRPVTIIDQQKDPLRGLVQPTPPEPDKE